MNNEEIIEQGLAAIRGQMVFNEMRMLINKHLKWHPTELRMLSAKYFVESGNVTGGFFLAIQDIALDMVKFFQSQPLLNNEQKPNECDANTLNQGNTADNQ